MKLYCFQYYVKENNIYRYEYEPESVDNYGYHIADEEDDVIHVDKNAIDDPRATTIYCETDEQVIYVYTLVDDVNRAMKLMEDSFNETVEAKKKELEMLQSMRATFCAKRIYIQNKYPDGVKREEEIEKE